MKKLSIPLRFIFLAGFILLTAAAFFYSNIFAGKAIDESEYYDFLREEENIPAMMKAYHSTVNEIFNEQFENLNDAFKDGPNEETKNLLKPPKLEDNQSCSSDNLSTYCLAEELTGVFSAYSEAMYENSSLFTESSECESGSDDEESPVTIDEVTQYASARTTFISQEIEHAKETLDVALSVYNEFQTAYVMHRKYEEILESLQKYEASLYRIRKDVEKYPVKFVNVSTPNCT